MFGLNKILFKLGAAALAVVLIVTSFHLYRQDVIDATQQEVIEQVITQDKTTYIETRKRIDEAINVDHSADTARERLRARQERRKATE